MSTDRDQGDFDPTEVPAVASNAWHESMAPARMPVLTTKAPTEAGRRALAALRAELRAEQAGQVERRQAAPVASWPALPHLYRRMVVAAAGLDADVVGKIDRDLSEREKVMIRSAVSDMRAWLNTLVTL